MDILNHKILNKYLSQEWKSKIRIESSKILAEIKYLKMHSNRTSKVEGGWVIIPKPSFFHEVYGSGMIFWYLRAILSSSDQWEDNCIIDHSLESIISALVTNANILRDIFTHEDKDSINKEIIPDFIEWSEVLKEIYGPFIARNIWSLYDIDINYSHCSRFCQKALAFKEELEILTSPNKEIL